MEQNVIINQDKFKLSAFLSYSKNIKNSHGIILIHEIWGLNDNIRDIARRLNSEGYTVLAPDFLGNTGVLEKLSPDIFKEMGNPATKDEAQKKMRDALAPIQKPEFALEMINKLKASYNYLYKDQGVKSVSVMGFCFGGTYSFAFSVNEPYLKSCISFYGQSPNPLSDVSKINCPVIAFYGEKDDRLVSSLPDLANAMNQFKKDFKYKVYPDTGHAFFNDKNTQMYNEKAAKDSWNLVLDFLKKNL